MFNTKYGGQTMKMFSTYTSMDDKDYKPMVVRGVRWVAQASKDGRVWNKPQVSTYANRGGALYLDGSGQVQFSVPLRWRDGIHEAWWEKFGAGVPDVAAHLKDDEPTNGIRVISSGLIKTMRT
jgi:hypothetical protein